MKITILGIGNILLQDEGVGVRAIEYLHRHTLPPQVELVDGGTATLDLFTLFNETDHLVVVDAVKGGMRPGTIYRLEPKDLMPQQQAPISPHDLGLLDALDMASKIGDRPRSVVIFGVEPKEINWGMELTPEIKVTIPTVANLVLNEVQKYVKETKKNKENQKNQRKIKQTKENKEKFLS
jgi:hydrogenase maturation protease